MPCSRSVYPLVAGFLQQLLAIPHRTAAAALAQLVTALLVSQSLQPTPLARALLSLPTVPARQRYRRVQRLLGCPWLTPAWLCPRLVRGALALQPTARPLLALDTVRCGGWEIFTLGLVLPGRVQLLTWAVLPSPWPKGAFTPTACALVRQLAAAWPADQPRPHLVADRIFPSRALFQTCAALAIAYSVRLRAPQTVTVGGQVRRVRDLLAAADPADWTSLAAAYGQGAGAITGQLVLGRGLVVLPQQQRDAGSTRARLARAAKRAYDRKERHWAAAAETEAWVVLFSSEPRWLAAGRAYRGRYSTEGTYRDLQGRLRRTPGLGPGVRGGARRDAERRGGGGGTGRRGAVCAAGRRQPGGRDGPR